MGQHQPACLAAPKYRGAAPIQWAIAKGETAHRQHHDAHRAGLDTGDILLQRELAIGLEDTAESIAPALAELGADLVVETLHGLRAGTVQPRRQDDSQATLAGIKKEDGLVDFNRTAPEIFNRIRGFQPWPGACTHGKTLQILKAMPVAADTNMPSAQVSIRDGRLLVGCGQNIVARTFGSSGRRQETRSRLRLYPRLSAEAGREVRLELQ